MIIILVLVYAIILYTKALNVYIYTQYAFLIILGHLARLEVATDFWQEVHIYVSSDSFGQGPLWNKMTRPSAVIDNVGGDDKWESQGK